MDLSEQIKELAESHLKDESQFIVEVVASLRKKPNRLIVIVDGDQGVTIDDCANLSRAISDVLDKRDVLKDPYLLEVSTPGLDHPLKLKRQYFKNVGRRVRVKTRDSSVEGVLVSATQDDITLRQQATKASKEKIGEKNGRDITIPFDEIEKTFVLVSFKK